MPTTVKDRVKDSTDGQGDDELTKSTSYNDISSIKAYTAEPPITPRQGVDQSKEDTWLLPARHRQW